jgi:hypothetical protein
VIVHVILYKPQTNMADAARQQIMEGLATAATAIPSVRRFRVGKRVKHGHPGYEQAMHVDFEYAVIVEFDGVEGLTAYLSHPAHEAIGGHFTASASDSLAYDYDVFDLTTR